MQNRHTAFQAMLRFSRVTGVQEKYSTHHFAKTFVRMAKYDDVRPLVSNEPSKFFGWRGRIDNVMDEKFSAGEFDKLRFIITHRRVVRVAANRRDGGDGFQFGENLRQSNVARVENVADARKKSGNFRVEKIMRVGNDADFHVVGGASYTSPHFLKFSQGLV